MRRFLFTLLATLLAGKAMAAPCDPPLPVGAYLRNHPTWRLLQFADLVSDDQKLWIRQHARDCPGWARARLDASGRPSYALALVRMRARGEAEEMVVALRATASGYRPVVLMAPRAGNNFVVWRGPPGKVIDVYDGHSVRIRHACLIVEAMEASATAFYLERGRFRSVPTSD